MPVYQSARYPKATVNTTVVVAITATDTFIRSNANPISNPMSDGVSTWSTTAVGSWGATKILSNEIYASATAADSMARVATPAFGTDYEVEMTVPSGGITGSHFNGVAMRIGSAANGACYTLRFFGSSSTLRLEKWTDGGSLSSAQIGTDIAITPVSPGDKMSCVVSGTGTVSFQAKVNGSNVGGVNTDASSPYNSGQPGLVMYDSDGTRAGAGGFYGH